MLLRKTSLCLTALAIIMMLLAACQPGKPAATQQEQPPAAAPTASPAPTLTPTVPPRLLTICLGQEPSTLYAYGSSSRSTWSVLEAIYDGPFDTRQYSAQPVILQKLPTFADGDAVIQPIGVQGGEAVINTEGELVALEKGTQILPSGCTSLDCAIRWDGVQTLTMDQLVLTFKLLPGITWSDGTPLKASDSVYSFKIASSPDTPVNRSVVHRTVSYQALDDLTVEWKGVAGYIPQRFETLFFLPLPEHAWKGLSPKQLLSEEIASKKPLGWGAYIIQEWVAGDHIRLSKNPAYFRAAEGLPKFDNLVYRFLGEPLDNNLAALLSGECDVIDQTSLLDEQLEMVLELQQAKKLKAYIGLGPEWEHVDFGIKPASYDDGYSTFSGDRPDFFSDVRMRQAFAYCIDRQGIVDKLLYGQSQVPASYLPPSHPLFTDDVAPLPYDPTVGRNLLQELGWRDFDGDPNTPLVAANVLTVPPGTPLSVNYYTTQSPLRVEVAKRIVASLAECGIQVNVNYLTPGELYAPGPEGILFGRKFDLVQFSWDSGTVPLCLFYESGQIPSLENNWLTLNVTGYTNADYDNACKAARAARPDQWEQYVQNHQTAQRIFARDLPVIPLYFRPKLVISRPDFCNMQIDVTTRSAMWNLEVFDYGQNCP
ncbi:MAG: peptide ABC transporter substrate-binding protein [Anaerolineae bacterium]|nr:peptide ABC transporter substrate-binding protein [Anaerolineae bacterium]